MKAKRKTRGLKANTAPIILRGLLLLCLLLYGAGALLNHMEESTREETPSHKTTPVIFSPSDTPTPPKPVPPTHTPIPPTLIPPSHTPLSPTPMPAINPLPEVIEVDMFFVDTNPGGALLYTTSIIDDIPDRMELGTETHLLPGNLDSVGVFGVVWRNGALWFYVDVCDPTGYISDCLTYYGWLNANDVHLLAAEEIQQYCGSDCWADFHLYRLQKNVHTRRFPLKQSEESGSLLRKGSYILASHASKGVMGDQDFVGYRGFSWEWVEKDALELVW